MGQYYQPTSLDAEEHICPRDYGDGLKLMEHSWLDNDVMRAVCQALRKDGRWHKHHMAWIGDYAEDDEYLSDDCKKCMEDKTNFECKNYLKKVVGECKGSYHWMYSISNNIFLEVPTRAVLPVNYFILNHTKKEFVDTSKAQANDGWIIHPLPILTSVGNGRGGGDYHPTDEDKMFVGAWRGDSISISLKKPKGFIEIEPGFYQ